MKHLVLGGGGFIGSHLGRRLKDEGHTVLLVDVEFPSFRSKQYEGCTVQRGDMRHPWSVQDVIDYWDFDVIWQLAADMGGVEYFHSDKDWQAAINNQVINVNIMEAVAKWARDARVVFTSTACALAIEKQTHFVREVFTPQTWEWDNHNIDYTDKWELTEEDILWGTPDQLYGQEKRNSALLWNAAPIDTRVCFLHTVYGPYQEHSGIRMKFPSAVAQKARRARETGRIELLGDGRQVRSYLYIDDAIDRLVALGSSNEDPGFVNIGGTKAYTVDEVALIACKAAGHGEFGPEDYPGFYHIDGPTGVEARCADMTKFNTAFPEFSPVRGPQASGWPGIKAAIVPLETGMRKMIDWLDTL